MNKKLGLLAVPVIAGLGALSVVALNSSAHATPVTTQSSVASKEAPDATEAQDTTKADDPNGPNVEQSGQNETAN